MRQPSDNAVHRSTHLEIFNLSSGDADAQFQIWRGAHPEGFFLDCQANDVAKLHKSVCTDDQALLPVLLKVCGMHTKELRQWAARQGVLLMPCGGCKAN